MFTRKAVLFLLAGLLFVFSFGAAKIESGVSKPSHCYSLLSSVNTKTGGSSQVVKTACFDTFSEAIEAATNGRVDLDSSVLPADVTDAMLNSVDKMALPDAQIVIGIDFDLANFEGSTYTWVSTSACSDSVYFSASPMPSGWDNRISSAKAYSNCNNFYHYQDTNFSGPYITCSTDCPSMGSLDNATSSEKWTE